ncbi:MAG: hypothetical protein HQK99_03035 [Nitrospirae bacterium]|nr:hypothetical protein [Nitrospirota bacterium]
MTCYLFAVPSFMEGVARIIDIGGTMVNFNFSPTAEIADSMALKSDFQAVGDDIRHAMKGFSQENIEKASK